MTVNVADVLEAKFTNERTGKYRGGDDVFHRLGRVMQATTKRRDRQQLLFDFIFETVISVCAANPVQITSQGADCRRNRHLVVVQDNDESTLKMTRLVYRLHRH